MTRTRKTDSLKDKESLRRVRERAEAALKPLGEELGLQFRLGKCRYDPSGSNATFDLEVAIIKDGAAQSREVTAFRELAVLYGLQPEDLGKKVTIGAKQYVIAGIAPGRSKYPILADEPGGKRYKLPVESVKQALMLQRGESAPHCHVTRESPFEALSVLEDEPFEDVRSAGAAANRLLQEAKGKGSDEWFGIFAGCTCAKGKGLEMEKKPKSE